MVTVRNLVSPWVIPSRRLHHLAPSASHRGRLYHQAPMNRFQPKKVVEEGYDRIGERYARDATMTRQGLRTRHVNYLVNALPRGSDLLDLGCGAGTPTTKRLAEHFTVTGVDISQRQVEPCASGRIRGNFHSGRHDVAAAAAVLLRCRDSLLLHHSRPSGRTTRPASIDCVLAPTQRLVLRNDDRQKQGD